MEVARTANREEYKSFISPSVLANLAIAKQGKRDEYEICCVFSIKSQLRVEKEVIRALYIQM